MSAKYDQIVEEIIDWFRENPDAFEECIEDLDSYCGYLDDHRYYPMDELVTFCDMKDNPIDLLYMAFYGGDEYYEGEYDEHFNPNREYFRINAYGNLVSSNEKFYNMFLDKFFVDTMYQNMNHIWSWERYPELSALFEELNDCEGVADED